VPASISARIPTCPHGGLVQIMFLSKYVICRFQPLIFQGLFVRGFEFSLWVFGGWEPLRCFSQATLAISDDAPCGSQRFQLHGSQVWKAPRRQRLSSNHLGGEGNLEGVVQDFNSWVYISIQENYNTPVEHTPGNPPSPL